MSGGSMNYLYSRIESDLSFRLDTPKRRAFKAHMMKVIKALHDIEWVDSCDYGPGREVASIMACITPSDILAEAIAETRRGLANLNLAIECAALTQSKQEPSK